MIIEKIIIKNFLPFKEETEVSFSNDPQRNITILLAENNVGKTSLLKAFLWCLYGTDKEDNDNILNAETRIRLLQSREGSADSAIAKLFLFHNDEEYLIAREWRYTKSLTSNGLNVFKRLTVQKKINNYWNSIDDADDQEKIINSILPEDLSTYFFFEEKKFQSIGTTKNIKKSVEDFCGLTSMNTAIKDIEKVIIKFNNSLNTSGSDDLGNASKRMTDKQNALAQTNEQLSNAQSEKAYYEQLKEDNTNKLIGYAKDEEIQERYEKEKHHLENMQSEIPEKENKFFKVFNQQLVYFLENKKIFQESLHVLDDADNGESVDTISGVDVTSIEEILKRGYCICEAKITKDSDAYNHLIKEMSKVPPNNLSNSARDLRSHMNTISNIAPAYIDNVADAYKDYKHALNDCSRSKDIVNDLLEKAKDTVDTNSIRQTIAYSQNRIKENERKIEQLTRDSGQLQRDVELLSKRISKLSKNDEENRYIDKCKAYAIAVQDRIKNVLNREQQTVLEKMNQYVREYFKELYHGNLELVIDQNYNIQTYNSYDGEKVSTKLSTGTNDIKNFAFVFGLERLAQDHLNEDPDEENSEYSKNEPYPLVLDGPFSHTDGQHIENLCKLMPEVANQVIIAISRKDWMITKDHLRGKVAKIYEMKQITEENSRISPVESGDQSV